MCLFVMLDNLAIIKMKSPPIPKKMIFSLSPSALTFFALQITPLKISRCGFYQYNEINGIFQMIPNLS